MTEDESFLLPCLSLWSTGFSTVGLCNSSYLLLVPDKLSAVELPEYVFPFAPRSPVLRLHANFFFGLHRGRSIVSIFPASSRPVIPFPVFLSLPRSTARATIIIRLRRPAKRRFLSLVPLLLLLWLLLLLLLVLLLVMLLQQVVRIQRMQHMRRRDDVSVSGKRLQRLLRLVAMGQRDIVMTELRALVLLILQMRIHGCTIAA